MHRATATIGVLLLSLTLWAAPPAAGADDTSYPSRQQVQQARAAVADKTRDVGVIQAELVLANQRLDALYMAAQQAAEAYNGARWRLQQARIAAERAAEKAQRAEAKLLDQRKRLGQVVADHYQSSSELSDLGLLLGTDGSTSLLNEYSAFSVATQTMEADYARYDAAHVVAQVFRAEARQAVAARRAATEEAARLRQVAEEAVAGQQAAVAAVAQHRDQLLRELAAAQDISLQLLRQRQQALAAIQRERARAEAIAAAEAAAAAAAASE